MDLLGESGGPVRIAGRELARDELLRWASAVAAEIGGADAVAVHATPAPETVAAVVGGLLAGVPVVPLPPDSGPAERAHILGDSGAKLLLGARDAQRADDEPPLVPVDALPRDGDVRDAGADGDATALILYTSGTTGAPKGVLISRGAIAAGLDALAEAWEWTPEDVLVHGLPLFHVHGLVLGVLGALRVGSRLVHTGRPKPEAYAAAAAEAGGSLFFGVPTVWSRTVADPSSARALRGARLLVSGSAPLPVPVFERLADLTGHRPVERYGMTETLITVSARARGDRRPGYVGTPLQGVETRLAAEDGRPVPHDGETPGELHVRAPLLFKGYLNRPDATAESFTADGWFRTGDIATIGPDGWHRIVGRASTDLIKSGGYRIGAGEVENALLAHPAVREAAVVGTPHDDLGEQVTAYVVADGVGEEQLIEFVAARLSVHKRPRVVHLVDALPRNAMGKVVKTRLVPPKDAGSRAGSGAGGAA
ncbi:MAG TPA: acyl-CoA synthetase [Spirillospora sp.]